MDRTHPYQDSESYQKYQLQLHHLQIQLEDEKRKARQNPPTMGSPVYAFVGANPETTATRNNAKFDRATYNRAFRDYVNGRTSKELRDVTSASASGLFLIPQLFAVELTQAQRTYGPLGTLVNTVVGTQPHRFALSDDTQNNFTVLPETNSISGLESDPSLSSVLISETDSCVRVVKASIQTVRDSNFSIESFINDIAGQAYAQSVELNLTTGLDKPSGSQLIHTTSGGILAAMAAGSANVTAAANGAVAASDLDALYAALPYAYRVSKYARFMASPSVHDAIAALKGSDGRYVYSRNPETGNLAVQGIDLVVDNAMPAINATGSKPLVVLADRHRYWVAVNSGLRVQVLRERYIDNLQVGFVLSYRLGSQQALPASGVALVSHS